MGAAPSGGALPAACALLTRTGMPQRVLIVDDNEDARRILAVRLRGAGVDVGAAADGVEGLEALDRERWDLVVLDLLMPRMDGFQFLLNVRNRPTPPPPIIVMTSSGRVGMERAQALGAQRCVSKTFAFTSEFTALLRHCLQREQSPSGPGRRSPNSRF